MNKSYVYVLTKLKHLNARLGANKGLPEQPRAFDYSGQAASDYIKQRLCDDKPLMVARFGSVEMEALTIGYLKTQHSFFKNNYDFIKGSIPAFWWTDQIMQQMSNNAGFFPAAPKYLERYANLILHDLEALDVLGSWLPYEDYFKTQLKAVIKIPLQALEPYYHTHPWTAALQGKKVLVIHPYSASIAKQYQKRELLFNNTEVLPPFELVTLTAVQSIAGSATGYNTWFDALDHMKAQIDKTDFDMALIGCGAYGFCLAAHIKRMGKKAVHLGGATQILFGIKGKRWEDMDFFKALFNEHWARPTEEETPANSKNVERGCYW
jgi:hypothetical protein